jgi:hypothetical protein
MARAAAGSLSSLHMHGCDRLARPPGGNRCRLAWADQVLLAGDSHLESLRVVGRDHERSCSKAFV